MTVQEFKRMYMERNPQGGFFDAAAMAGRGESLADMRVTGKGIARGYIVYELIATQYGLLGAMERRYYFDEDTFTCMAVA